MNIARHILVVLASAGILAGAYAFTFGVPEQITNLWTANGTDTANASTKAANPGTGNPGVGRRGNQATAVVMAAMETKPYALVLHTVGTATSARRATVTSSEAGEVVDTALAANGMVEKGDILLRLDDRSQRLAVEIAEAERDQAKDTLERYESLQSNGSLTVSGVTLAEAQVALRLAEANLGMAELALENRTVTAPISGRMGLSNVQVGDLLSAGDAIVTIDETRKLVAEFEVPERSIGLLETGKTVRVGTPTYTGRVFEGHITAFDSRLDPVTRSVTVKAEIDNAEGLLWSGMTFSVRMIEETEPLPMLPATAVTWDRSGAGIWVVTDGRASRQPVVIKYREGDSVWLDTDVAPGALVVTEGAAKLRDGAAVSGAPTALTGEPSA